MVHNIPVARNRPTAYIVISSPPISHQSKTPWLDSILGLLKDDRAPL
jgi:methylglyoxal synthase